MQKWLIIYDIRDPKRLQKISKKMTEYATRVQKSVFEIEAPKKIVNILREKIRKLMEEEDYVVYFSLCERDWQKRIKYGPETFELEEDKSYYIY